MNTKQKQLMKINEIQYCNIYLKLIIYSHDYANNS